jgi:type I restriction enzyme M protein
MLNSETKKHIDAARDVLVGVAPNPMTQIDQITYALIYKFMDDMDQSAIKAGGEPSFFVGELEPYAWGKLVDTRMGNQEMMNLYGEALQKFAEAKQLPELFRTIFRSAFLPYRSPETLGLFLKEINYFDYTHPEELGNAYEYLLSIMSAQGDAGQFRTPRHIIDFMVDVVNPTKNDKVLDPACGTGGFLVASYNHILEQHDGLGLNSKDEKPLTPDERKKLMNNFEGYDIDPSMVRIAQVNMYLHQFKNPQIFQYDSLTSEDRWNDKFDVVLANPPFMSPKGGIKPHNKFALQSNRSEVLFVDYIATHLKPNGRAAIIVPEGIIFQAGKAYRDLRKNLVENGLYSVISLPSGVFQPYSGVKTSILLIDKEIAKLSESILFIKITSDGFDPGAKKKVVETNDLPEALEVLQKHRIGQQKKSELALHVSKKRLEEDGEYNLSADRYRVGIDYSNIKWPLTSLADLEEQGEIEFVRGQNLSKSELDPDGKTPCIHYGELYSLYGPVVENVISRTNSNGRVVSVAGDVLVPATQTADALGMARGSCLNEDGVIIGGDINVIRTRNKVILGNFLAYAISTSPLKQALANFAKGVNILHLSNKDLRRLSLPLPPIEEQERLINEISKLQSRILESKQKIQNLEGEIEETVLQVWK